MTFVFFLVSQDFYGHRQPHIGLRGNVPPPKSERTARKYCGQWTDSERTERKYYLHGGDVIRPALHRSRDRKETFRQVRRSIECACPYVRADDFQ